MWIEGIFPFNRVNKTLTSEIKVHFMSFFRLFPKHSVIISFLLTFLFSCKSSVTGSNNKQNTRTGNLLAVGKSAHDLLADNNFNKLIVEIQYASGFKPTQTAIDSLQAFLNRRLNKPNGITIALDAITAPGNTQYTLNQIEQIEQTNRQEYNDGKTIAVYYFFADGDYSGNTSNTKVLGMAYRNTSIVIFENTIQNLSGGIGQPSTAVLETTVMEHEFGHILGLVNIGTPMVTNHEDPNHPGHCNNSKCLMYYNVDTGDIVSNLLGGTIPQLDQNCLTDLKNNGGK